MIINQLEIDWLLNNFKKNPSHRNMKTLSLAEEIHIINMITKKLASKNLAFTQRGLVANFNEDPIDLYIQDIYFHKKRLMSKYCNKK